MAYVNQEQADRADQIVLDSVLAYGYISPDDSPADIVLTLADTWYEGGYSLTYTELFNASEGATGISIDKAEKIGVMHKLCCQSDKTAQVRMALVKNGAFTGGVLDDEADILLGSCDLMQADVTGPADGVGSVMGNWIGDASVGDEFTAVFMSDSSATTLSPLNASIAVTTEIGVGV